MALYETFLAYSGAYAPTMPLFRELEEMWPELLRQIGEGGSVEELTGETDEILNTKLEETYGITAILPE